MCKAFSCLLEEWGYLGPILQSQSAVTCPTKKKRFHFLILHSFHYHVHKEIRNHDNHLISWNGNGWSQKTRWNVLGWIEWGAVPLERVNGSRKDSQAADSFICPQKNRVAECQNWIIIYMGQYAQRSKQPGPYWAKTVSTALYILNWSFTEKMTTTEAYSGKKPSAWLYFAQPVGPILKLTSMV